MKHAGVIFTSVSAGKNVRDEKCKSFLREKRKVKFGENSRPPKTERGREKSSGSETVIQGQRWPGQNLFGSITCLWSTITNIARIAKAASYLESQV